MAKVLITGGTGFLGTHIARDLVVSGHEVVLFDSYPEHVTRDGLTDRLRAHRLSDLLAHVQLVQGDVRGEAFAAAMQEHAPQHVIHLAAVADAHQALGEPEQARSINVHGLLHVLETIRRFDVQRFVFASSSFVYGHFQLPRVGEDHQLKPIDPYGRTKLTGETLTRAFCSESDIEWVVLRPSAVYGFGDSNRRVTRIFMENAVRGWSLLTRGGGVERLDFTDVEDAAHGFAQATLHPGAANGTFNLTRGEGRSITELARIVQRHFPGAQIVDRPERRIEVRPVRGELDSSRARARFDFDPRTSLEDGIAKYAAQLRERASWLDLHQSVPA